MFAAVWGKAPKELRILRGPKCLQGSEEGVDEVVQDTWMDLEDAAVEAAED